MADVTIGGQTFTVSLPNFKKLKAAWRFIATVQASTDPMDSVDAILGIVSVGSASAITVDELENALTPAEMPGLAPFVNALMVEVGLAKKPEDEDPTAPAEETASPSTAISTPSSAPSSADSDPQTGTA
jgi:hypothetical protein